MNLQYIHFEIEPCDVRNNQRRVVFVIGEHVMGGSVIMKIDLRGTSSWVHLRWMHLRWKVDLMYFYCAMCLWEELMRFGYGGWWFGEEVCGLERIDM